MKTRSLILGIAFAAILVMGCARAVDSDTWWHLRAGEWILQHGALPEVDRFSFSRAGVEWHYPGWLADVLLAAFFRLGGAGALNLLNAAIVLFTFFFIARTCQGDGFLKAFALVLSASAASIFWSARPQIFTFLLSGIFFWILWRFDRTDRNGLWLLPPLMALWTNLHGGFAAGFIFIALALAGQSAKVVFAPSDDRRTEVRKWLWLCATGAACLLAAGLNPYGFEMLSYPFRTVSIRVLQDLIQEWQSPNFHTLQTQPFLWMIILTWLATAISGRTIRIWDFGFLACTIYLGMTAARNIYLLAIVAPAVLVEYGDTALHKFLPTWKSDHEESRVRRTLNGFLLGLIAMLAAWQCATNLQPDALRRQAEERMPVGAVEHLGGKPGLGRILNSYNWGAYLLWHLPEYPVFVDGRTDLYSDEILGEYLTMVYGGAGWEEKLTEWDIHLVLLEPGMPLVQLLKQNHWRLEYADEEAVILLRP